MSSPERTKPVAEPKDSRWPLGKPSQEDLTSFRELTRSDPRSPITRRIDDILTKETE